MAYDRQAAERIRQALARRQHLREQGVVEKRMVGGLSFMVAGSMCCGVTGDALMVRVGSEAREQLLGMPHVRPMVLGGRALAGFVCVEPAGYREQAALEWWVEQGLSFLSSQASKRRGGRLGRPPPDRML